MSPTVYCPKVLTLAAKKYITTIPNQAPAGIHKLDHPACAAYSAPAINVPEPIQVQISVNTITFILKLRPATMKSSWLFIFLLR